MNKILFILLIVFLTCSCSVKFKSATDLNRDYPDFVLGEFKYISADSLGRREWDLRAKEAKMYNSKSEIYLYNLAMTFYNADNSVKSFMTANSGFVDKISYNVHAEGKVRIYSQNEAILESEKVYWDNVKKQFYTQPEDLVTLIRGNTVIKGYKMMADEGLKQVKMENIKADVKK